MSDFSQPIPQDQDAPVNPQQPTEFTPEPLPEPPALPFTMKANLTDYRKRLGWWRIVIAVVLIAVIYVRFGMIPGIISTAIIAVTVFIFLLVLSKRSITLTQDTIEYRSVFGGLKQLKYEDISSVKVFLAYIEPAFGHTPRVIVGKKGGGALFSLVTLYWKVEDIDLLLSVLNSKKILNESYVDPAMSPMIAKQFPDYVSAYERHPYWIAFGIILVLAVAITIFVLLTM